MLPALERLPTRRCATIPSPELLESENTARLRLDEARERLHTAMTRALIAAESRPPQCAYVLSDSLSDRCSLPAGHEGNHYVEAGDPRAVPSTSSLDRQDSRL